MKRWAGGGQARAPDRSATVTSRGRSLAAVGQILFLEGKYVAGLDVEVACIAHAARDILEPRVIGAGGDAGDPQPLVGIDGAVLVVLALVLAPCGGAGGRELEFRDGVARQ